MGFSLWGRGGPPWVTWAKRLLRADPEIAEVVLRCQKDSVRAIKKIISGRSFLDVSDVNIGSGCSMI